MRGVRRFALVLALRVTLRGLIGLPALCCCLLVVAAVVLHELKMKNPPHPGFSVRVDCLEPHGLSVTEGAKVLGVSRSALSHLVNENANLSWDIYPPGQGVRQYAGMDAVAISV